MTFALPLIIIIIGYLLGSVSGGYFAGKLAGGVDVRKYGSKNIGMTNVLRVLGKRYAFFAFLIDFGKGMASVYLPNFFSTNINPQIIRTLAGLACISGHNWPIFLKFRGGKGVATTAGVFSILTPLPFFLSLATMVAVVAATRYVSLGSMVSAAALPFYIWALMGTESLIYIYLGIGAAVLVICRHHSNLKRLLLGKESKIGERVKIKEGG